MRTTIRSAVQNEAIGSGRGVLQRLFAVWFDAFVYNQIWEDPVPDLAALELDETSRILAISSGGCNILNYLLRSPRSITAVDLNRHHIELLKYKAAAVIGLPDHDRFFAFFGRGRTPNAESDHLRFIAPHLDPESRRYWETNSFVGTLLNGSRVAMFRNAGLYDHSRNGRFLKFFHKFAHLIGRRPEMILSARSPQEQAVLFERHIAPFFDNLVIKAIGKLPVTAFGLGIPPQQYAELKHAAGGSVIDVYRERVRHLACGLPIADNYFAWQAFARRYDTDGLRAIPDYLRKENFELLKANISRLHAEVASITDSIAANPPGTFDRFVFLDAQDWMSPDALAQLWRSLNERAADGSRVIFRTAAADSPVESLPSSVRSRFVYERERSTELFAKDRAAIYGGFHLYRTVK